MPGSDASITSFVAAAALAGTLLLVPFAEVRKLTPFGLWGGFAVGLTVFTLGGPVLHLWRFADRATVAGIPIMLTLAWYPGEILFAYAFKLFARRRQRIAVVLGAALAATLVQGNLESRGVWQEIVRIPSSAIFAFSAAVHAVLALYLWRHREEPRRSSIPPLA